MDRLGRYSLIRQIGAGGMAEVFLARALGAQGIEKQLVIKKILPALASNRRFVQMFVDEARVAMRLNHSNIVQVYDFEQLGDVFILAMEYVDGSDLLALQQAARRRDLRMPFGLAAFVLQELAKGLDYAHARTDERGAPLDIVHRDVSPQNVLISRDGAVKITDFGIARARWAHDEATGGLKGKLGYMSPEQAAGRPVDRRSDIFSLGVVLHELLTGRHLLSASSGDQALARVRAGVHPSPREIDPGIPEELDAVVRRAMALDPVERYERARDLARDLGVYLHGAEEIIDAHSLETWAAALPIPEAPPAAPPGTTRRARASTATPPTIDEETQPLRGIGEIEQRTVVLVESRIELEPHPARAVVSAELTRLAGEMAYKADGVLTATGGGFRIYLGLSHSSMEDAIRGIRLAFDVLDAARALSRDHHLAVEVRSAVNRGHARFSGGAGGSETAFDPDPELLARAASALAAAHPGEVLTGGGVYRLARRDYNFDEPRALAAAGDDADTDAGQGLKAYRVLGARSRAERRRDASDDAGAFQGRELELRRLHEAYGRAAAGRTTVLSVIGELGIGKSRLIARFLETLDPEEHRAIVAECVFAERDAPLAAAAAVVRAALELDDGDSTRSVDQGLAALLAGAPAYLARQERFFGELLGSPDQAWTINRGRQRDLIRRVAYGLGVLLVRAARARCVVLVLENAHWLDAQSVDVLAELASAAPTPARVLVLIAGQPGTLAGRRIDGLARLELPELPDRVMREIVIGRLGRGEEMEAIADQILDRAGGNPFFAQEIVDSLIERGIITEVTGEGGARYRQARPGAIQLPTTMEGLAAGQIDALAAEPRATLRAAAAIGARFDEPTLSRLVGRPVGDDIRELVRRGILAQAPAAPGAESQYHFRKAMVRQAAYDGLAPPDRRRLHRALADELIAGAEQGAAVPAARIAWHLERCGEGARAGHYYMEAGHAAWMIHSSRHAVRLFDRAIPLLPAGTAARFEALARREKVLRDLGRHRQRDADIAEMLAIAIDSGDDGKRALARHRQAQLDYDEGDFVGAARALGEVLEIAARAGDAALQVEALRLLAYVATEEGHLIRALDCCDRALRITPAGRQGLFLRARALGIKGLVQLYMGYLALAPAPLAEALVLFRNLGMRRNESITMSNLGLLAQARGELVEGIRFLERAMRVDRVVRDVSARGRKLAALGSIRVELGDLEGARAALEEALATCRENHEPVGQAEAELGLAELCLELEQYERAREILARPEHARFVPRSRLLLTRHHQIAALIRLELGELEAARRSADEATRIAFDAGMNGEVIHGRARQAVVLAGLGLPGEAVAAARRATDLLADVGGVRRAEEVWWFQARTMHAAGMTARTERALDEARREVDRKLALIPGQHYRALYESQPLVRAIRAGFGGAGD